METTRQAAVAGLFYPSDPGELRAVVQHYLEPALAQPRSPVPKAIIAPHAGYIYSGAFRSWGRL